MLNTVLGVDINELPDEIKHLHEQIEDESKSNWLIMVVVGVLIIEKAKF